jgi:hypothetical protein
MDSNSLPEKYCKFPDRGRSKVMATALKPQSCSQPGSDHSLGSFASTTQHMRRTQLLPIIALLAVVTSVAIPSLAQQPVDNAITNADVVRMVKAGIPENVIVRAIQVSATNFVTTPDALIGLKHQHVPDGVLSAIVESQSGERLPQAEPVGPAYIGVQTSAARPRHLPTFDAAVRVNAKTTEKISVGQNHIKVEQAGVPIFTLKWKDSQSK